MEEEISLLPGLDVDAVENVYVFVSDALRWDALPDRVATRGITAKTIAHALCTPQSIPSIVSGVYPPRHGVTWFSHSMNDELETVFDLEGVDTGFVETEWDRPLDGVLNDPPARSVPDLEPPFVCIEHDHGGHTPYPRMPEATPTETFSAVSRDPHRLRRWYEEGVAESVNRFERRLEELEDRDLLAETLVIFTSDHGELLGERGGFTGHMLPPTPEVAIVPTTFIHPSLGCARFDEAFFQHVDLLPTICDLLNRPNTGPYDGSSVLRPVPTDRLAYTHGTVHPPERLRGTWIDPAWEAPSVWDPRGGHVFVQSPLPHRLLTAVYETFFSGYTAAYNEDRNSLRTLSTNVRMYLETERTYGTPTVDRSEANAFLERVREQQVDTDEIEITDDTRETLQELGYL